MSSKLTARMAALLALHDLGGSHRAVDTEDVAMRAAQVAPTAFRWKKYPDQVNLEAVRLSLKSNKDHALVSGGIRDGWQLTLEGLKACEPFRDDLKAKEEAQRIRASKAFAAWQNGGLVTRAALLEVLRINDYFPETRRRQRVVAFLNAAGKDPDLGAFALALERAHPEVMNT